MSELLLQSHRHGLELRQRCRQILDDLAGKDVRGRQAVQVLERLVAQPSDVQVRLVTGDEFVVGEGLPPLAILPFAPPARLVCRDEVVEVGAAERILLE